MVLPQQSCLLKFIFACEGTLLSIPLCQSVVKVISFEKKTFLIYLNYMPNKIEDIDGGIIYSSDIPIDFNIANELRKL